MFSLFDEGSWDASISGAYNDAYEIAMASGDVARAHVFAERAYHAKIVIEKDDSHATAKMERRAEKHARQTPQEMRKDKFENWLWMLNGG